MNRKAETTVTRCLVLAVFLLVLLQAGARAQTGCCFENGVCENTVPQVCVRAGGTPVDGGCTPGACLGACCSDNECFLTTLETCSLSFYYGIGTTCQVCQGACCQCDGTCSDTLPGTCAAASGHFFGNGTLCSERPCGAPNDDCTDATQLPYSPSVSVPFENRCATTDGPATVGCDNGAQPVGNDMWYEYVAPCDGTVRASLCGTTDFDSVLLVYGGGLTCACPADAPAQIACGDDTCGVQGGPSYVLFNAQGGHCYLIRVAGWQGATGNGVLNVTYDTTCAPPSPGACCLPDGSCEEREFTLCTSAAGAFQGSGVACAGLQCGGACCEPDGSCRTSAAHACTGPGEFRGLGTTCAGTQCGGACCTESGCTTTSPSACAGNDFLGLGSVCGQVDCYGACCDPQAGCFDAASTASCTGGGGEFLGRGTRCASTDCIGACCDPATGCFDTSTVGSCNGFGAEHHGRGTRCASTTCFGACCLPEKACLETTPNACENFGGLYQGDGSSCLDECPGRMRSGFTYQGQLRHGGAPYSGMGDFRFTLWDLPSEGQVIAGPLAMSSVEVGNGLFQVQLDFGESALNGNARWLEVAVCTENCAGPESFSRLEPRQSMTAVPYALQTRGIVVDEQERVGIGTKNPGTRLSVVGNADVSANLGIGTRSPTSMLHLSRPGADTAIRFQTSRLSLDPALTANGTPTASGGAGWTAPANALSSDDTYAQGVSGNGVLNVSGFGFSLPREAVVVGITVTVEGHEDSCSCTGFGCDDCFAAVRAQLSGGSSPSLAYAIPLNDGYTTGDMTRSVGGALDSWGLVWDGDQVNSAAFGLYLAADGVRLCEDCRYNPYCGTFPNYYPCTQCYFLVCENQTASIASSASVDAVSITVYYYPTAIGDLNLNWSVGLSQEDSNFRIAPTADLSAPHVVITRTGLVGIGVAEPTVGLELPTDGSSQSYGVAKAWLEYSSGKWKENVRPIPDALQTVLRLQGVMYDWAPHYGGDSDIGFVAEDVSAVVPELVKMEPDGKNAVGMKYDRVSALTVEAIKELHAELLAKQREIDALRAESEAAMTDLRARQEAALAERDRQVSELRDRLARLEAALLQRSSPPAAPHD